MSEKLEIQASSSRKAVLLYALLLFTGRRHYLPDLAERLSCTKPTVLRLMREIENAGVAAIETGIENRRRWYQLTTPPGTPHISLSRDEVERMALCRDLLERFLPGGMERMVSDGLAKVSTLMDKVEQRGQATAPKAGRMVKGYIDYTPFQGHIDCLLKAAASGTVCAITYKAPGKEPRVFEIVPVRLMADAEVLNIDGWRVTEKGTPKLRSPLTLAIHRMLDCIPTRRTLKDCPPLPEPKGAFGLIGDQPFPVRVAFDARHSQHVRERIWNSDQTFTDLPDGGVELTFTATSPEQVASWILSFGGGADLLEPENVRGMIRAQLREMTAIYADDTAEG